MLGHGNRGETVFTHSEAHFDVRLGGMSDGVSHLVEIGIELFGGSNAAFLVEVHKEFELVPRDFARTHPKRGDFDLTLGAFIVVAAVFAGGASHQEAAAWDGDEVECHIGAGDTLGVGFHLFFANGLGVRCDALVN